MKKLLATMILVGCIGIVAGCRSNKLAAETLDRSDGLSADVVDNQYRAGRIQLGVIEGEVREKNYLDIKNRLLNLMLEKGNLTEKSVPLDQVMVLLDALKNQENKDSAIRNRMLNKIFFLKEQGGLLRTLNLPLYVYLEGKKSIWEHILDQPNPVDPDDRLSEPVTEPTPLVGDRPE